MAYLCVSGILFERMGLLHWLGYTRSHLPLTRAAFPRAILYLCTHIYIELGALLRHGSSFRSTHRGVYKPFYLFDRVDRVDNISGCSLYGQWLYVAYSISTIRICWGFTCSFLSEDNFLHRLPNRLLWRHKYIIIIIGGERHQL